MGQGDACSSNPFAGTCTSLPDRRKRGPRRRHSVALSSSKTRHTTEKALDEPHPHGLRHAHSSSALETGVAGRRAEVPAEPRIADVSFGYLLPGRDHLRACQETASARILEAIGLRATDSFSRIHQWSNALAAGGPVFKQ